MSLSVPVQQGGVVMVTQMYPSPPQGGLVGNPNNQHMIGLGVVQIMISLMVFSFGVVALLGSSSLAVLSGFFIWGSLLYITAGSLTVAAGKSYNRCLVITSMVFNILASLAALYGTFIYALDAAVMYSYDCDNSECYMYEIIMQGMGGVLAVFNFLEFFITIVAASLAGKFACNSGNQLVYIIPGEASKDCQAPPSYFPSPATVVQLHPQGPPTYYPDASTSKAHPPLMNTTVGFNIFASLVAFSGFALYGVNAGLLYLVADLGMSSVLTVLHFLEFIITIVAASLACKCCCNSGNQQQQQPVYIVPGNASMAPQAPPSYSPPPATMGQLPPQGLPTYQPAESTSMAHP